MGISLTLRKQLQIVKEALETLFDQFALAPILLGKEVFTQDGYSIGLITDIYLGFNGKAGQIIVAEDQHIPVDEIMDMGNRIIVLRSWREVLTQKGLAGISHFNF